MVTRWRAAVAVVAAVAALTSAIFRVAILANISSCVFGVVI